MAAFELSLEQLDLIDDLHDDARPTLDKALAAFEVPGDHDGVATALMELGNCHPNR